MGEKKFMNCILTESILLLVLGFGILLFPKIAPISFGFMLCFSFLAYGGYKIINAYLTKASSNHYILTILSGFILFLAGLLLYFAPFFDVMFIISSIGTYFVLESITSFAFLFQTRTIFTFNKYNYFLAILELLCGLFVIILLPPEALWIAGILAGIDFLLSGVILAVMYYSNKYVH